MINISRNNIKHFLFKLLLLLFMGSSYLGATHIHPHDLDHDDGCDICVIVNNFHSADIFPPALELSAPEYDLAVTPVHDNLLLTHIHKGFHSTAPPVY